MPGLKNCFLAARAQDVEKKRALFTSTEDYIAAIFPPVHQTILRGLLAGKTQEEICRESGITLEKHIFYMTVIYSTLNVASDDELRFKLKSIEDPSIPYTPTPRVGWALPMPEVDEPIAKQSHEAANQVYNKLEKTTRDIVDCILSNYTVDEISQELDLSKARVMRIITNIIYPKFRVSSHSEIRKILSRPAAQQKSEVNPSLQSGP